MMIFSCCLIACFVTSNENLNTPDYARKIDDLLERIYAENSIAPNSIVDDLTFLRRASLDLIGRIPTLQEIKIFQSSPNRHDLIDRLIASTEFDQFLSEAWTTWLIGYSDVFQTDRETFRVWLQEQIQQDQSFKTIVSRILTAEGSAAINGPTNFLARHYNQPTTAVCRSFLGVRLECAQCHDHPFDRWTQDDYQAMQRFFEPMRRKNENGVAIIFDESRNRAADQRPKFLTGSKPRTQRYRQELSLYLTNCKPFARNFANRVWYFLMGKGVVDPPDDINQENQPVDGELFELLAQTARDNDFNVKKMFTVICKTKAYQRAIANSTNSVDSVRLFAAKSIKPMLPIQYLDSLLVGLDRNLSYTERRELMRRLVNLRDLNEDYQRLWDYRESVQQMMNKITFEFKGSIEGTKQVTPSNLYLRLLTRMPTENELAICSGLTTSDIMFSLALGNEFFFNH